MKSQDDLFPKPHTTTLSALNYFDSATNKIYTTGGTYTPNYAEMKPTELLKHYLLYVTQHLENGLFYKPDKEVAADLGISEDKAQRVKKKAIEKEYLTQEVKRYLKPNRRKINLLIGGI